MTQTQRLYREAYERKLPRRPPVPAAGAVRIDHAEDARLRAEAILGAYEILGEQPDWIHTHPAETRDWAERGEMRFAEGRWLYVDRQTGETLDMDEVGPADAVDGDPLLLYRPQRRPPICGMRRRDWTPAPTSTRWSPSAPPRSWTRRACSR